MGQTRFHPRPQATGYRTPCCILWFRARQRPLRKLALDSMALIYICLTDRPDTTSTERTPRSIANERACHSSCHIRSSWQHITHTLDKLELCIATTIARSPAARRRMRFAIVVVAGTFLASPSGDDLKRLRRCSEPSKTTVLMPLPQRHRLRPSSSQTSEWSWHQRAVCDASSRIHPNRYYGRVSTGSIPNVGGDTNTLIRLSTRSQKPSYRTGFSY